MEHGAAALVCCVDSWQVTQPYYLPVLVQVNAVVASIRFDAGDVLLMTTATYPAVRSTLARAAAAAGRLAVPLQCQGHTALLVQRFAVGFGLYTNR